MGVRNFAKRIVAALNSAKAGYRFGGINQILVSQIMYEEALAGKNIIVTGGGSGIGLAIAKKAYSLGANVLITGRNEQKLVGAIQNIGAEAKYLVWDVSETEQVDMKVLQAINLLGGKIDILVNNAGVQPEEFFPKVSEKEWDRIYSTNSKGLFFLSQAMCNIWLKEERENGYRKILNISSQGGFMGATYPYRMTKWDIRGFTQGLGLVMAKHGILVNAIAPGVVKTAMQTFSIQQEENTFCGQNPLERVCLPEEVAEVAVFMMSDACNFMVGQTILMDGGCSLK